MCISAAVIAGASLAASAVTAGTAIMSNNANKANAQYQVAMQKKEMGERAKLAHLEALQAENAKRTEFEITRSRQMAALATMAGFNGENISFFDGIEPEQQRQLGETVRAIRLGLTAEQSSVRDQIQIADFGGKISSFNSRMANIGAIGQFAADAVGAASYYNTYKKPGG